MPVSPTSKILTKTIIGMLFLFGSLAAPLAASPTATHASKAGAAYPPLVIGDQIMGAWTRNFNPFMTANALDPTIGGIYETLYDVVTLNNARQVPLLATGYAWSKDLKTLTFTIRQGVKWSDGQPFGPADVLFSMNLGKTCAVCNGPGLWGAAGTAVSDAQAGNTVSITFKQVDTTVDTFSKVVNNLVIVPRHIWASIAHPDQFANPNPVGTGPFTQVQNFSPQSYDVGKNPHFWQAGEPKFDLIRYPAVTGNDAALLDLKSGKTDWSNHFVGNVQDVYVKLNSNYHAVYLAKDTPINLYFNLQKYPYSIPAFRKAVSMGIDRMAIVNSALFGYPKPATATGLDVPFPTWVNHALDAQSKALTTYNPTAAKALLVKAGFKYKGSTLVDPKGNSIVFDIIAPLGWTDWDAAATVEAQNLQDLGINASTRQFAYGDYWGHLSTGNYDAIMSWTDHSATPFTLYHDMLARATYAPVGTALSTGLNVERYQDSAATEQLFSKFTATTSASPWLRANVK